MRMPAARVLAPLGRLNRGHKIIIAVSGCALVALALVSGIGAASGSARPAAGPPPLAKSLALTALGHAGAQVALDQYQGRAVVVNFFASWCVPCKAETPLLARFYRGHHGQVPIIGVDVNDNAATALRFVAKAGVTYPVGADPAGATATRYGVVAIPQTFFLNASHHIVKRVFGAVTLADMTAGLARMG